MDSIQPLVSISSIESKIGYNRSTIKAWEKSGLIKEGVHFARPGRGHRRYNVAAMETFVMSTSREVLNKEAETSNLLRAIALSAQPSENNQCLVPTILIDAIRKILKVKRHG